MVGKRLGRIVAQKKRALTAMCWREVGMGKGTKRAWDSEKKVRGKNTGTHKHSNALGRGWTGRRKTQVKKSKAISENTGHSQIQQCIGERLDKVTKKAGEKKKARGEKLGRIVARKRRALTAMRW